MEVKEIRKQVMTYIMSIEKRTFKESADQTDGEGGISETEAINLGKMSLLVEIIGGLEDLFKSLEESEGVE